MNNKLKLLSLSGLVVLSLNMQAQTTVWYENNTSAAQTSNNWFDEAIWSARTATDQKIPQNTAEVNAYVNLHNNLYVDSDVSVSSIWLKTDDKVLSVENGATLTLTQGYTNQDGKFNSYIEVADSSALVIGGDSNGNVVLNGGSVTTKRLNGGNYTINSGSFSVDGYIQNKANVKVYGGSLNLQNGNIDGGASVSLFGGSLKMANDKTVGKGDQENAATITFGGGKLYNDPSERLDLNNANLIFGASDEGVFKAASAHSIEVGNRLRIYPGTMRFNMANANLLTDSSSASLKDNAFVYSAGEISMQSNDAIFVTLDFSNIDFSGLNGDYFVSLFAMEKDFHADTQPVFSYIDSTGLSNDIVYGEEYQYSEDVSFEVIHDTSINSYYVSINVVPEPATYAAIFGTLAIAIAFIRRRK